MDKDIRPDTSLVQVIDVYLSRTKSISKLPIVAILLLACGISDTILWNKAKNPAGPVVSKNNEDKLLFSLKTTTKVYNCFISFLLILSFFS